MADPIVAAAIMEQTGQSRTGHCQPRAPLTANGSKECAQTAHDSRTTCYLPSVGSTTEGREVMTSQDRIAKIQSAAKELPAALKAAKAQPDSHELWAVVEQIGATIHRQSRLLAGKPRGG